MGDIWFCSVLSTDGDEATGTEFEPAPSQREGAWNGSFRRQVQIIDLSWAVGIAQDIQQRRLRTDRPKRTMRRMQEKVIQSKPSQKHQKAQQFSRWASDNHICE